MRIATYNVNGVNGPHRGDREAGYQALWHGQKSWNGVAILSRIGDITERRRVLPGDPEYLHSRYIEAEVAGLVIGCLYLPNGNPAPGPKFDYKLDWFKRFNAHAKKLITKGEPVILCGDYNVIPTDLDAHKPERWVKDALFFPESKAAYKKLVDQGWTDSLRELNPDKVIYTFWDYFYNSYKRDNGLRSDHILLSPSISKRLKTGGVDRFVREWEKTSDHAPVWIELKKG